MSSVFDVVGSAIYSKLTAGTALINLLGDSLSIYPIVAPDEAVFPYVVYSHHSGAYDNYDPVESKNIIYFIRAFSEVTPRKAGLIDVEIDALLHKKPLTVAGWDNFWIARDTDLENFESMPTGEKVFMRGGLYRLRLAKE